jgi:SAM-dependent methyltransferase
VKDEEILGTIHSFPRWHYQFDLKGHLTPVAKKGSTRRHLLRKQHFFDPLVELAGGSLAGKRVLDLGCNAGYWALLAIENGCEFALGIDGRQMHVDQANFVFKVKEIDPGRYQFVVGDIFDLDFREFGTFDIVLCLGLMYHISKPILLMEKISQVNSDLLLIDTRLSSADGACLELRRDRLDDPRSAVDHEMVLIPTKSAVFEIVQQFGYSVVMLTPQFQGHSRENRYKHGTRGAFLCAKRTDLSHLSGVEKPEGGATRHAGTVPSTVGKLARRVRSRILR